MLDTGTLDAIDLITALLVSPLLLDSLGSDYKYLLLNQIKQALVHRIRRILGDMQAYGLAMYANSQLTCMFVAGWRSREQGVCGVSLARGRKSTQPIKNRASCRRTQRRPRGAWA